MEGEIISTYTSDEAVEDGTLFDISTVNPAWKKGLFSHVTTNLLGKGYLEKNGKVRVVNLVDLLNQCNELVRKATKNFKEPDTFFSGEIEFPSGRSEKVFIGLNEKQKFTIMLPEDY